MSKVISCEELAYLVQRSVGLAIDPMDQVIRKLISDSTCLLEASRLARMQWTRRMMSCLSVYAEQAGINHCGWIVSEENFSFLTFDRDWNGYLLDECTIL